MSDLIVPEVSESPTLRTDDVYEAYCRSQWREEAREEAASLDPRVKDAALATLVARWARSAAPIETTLAELKKLDDSEKRRARRTDREVDPDSPGSLLVGFLEKRLVEVQNGTWQSDSAADFPGKYVRGSRFAADTDLPPQPVTSTEIARYLLDEVAERIAVQSRRE